jgi:hypothetical protein
VKRQLLHGAILTSVDTSAAEAEPGVTVVNEDGLVAVLHEDREVADQALGLIEADFDVPEATVDDQTIWDHILTSAPDGRTGHEAGSLDAGERASTKVFESTFYDGYAALAPMEPHTALASVEGGRIQLWDYHVYMAGTRGADVLYEVPNAAVVSHSARGVHLLATGP